MPDKLIPLSGVIRELAERESQGSETPAAKIRAFYDYVYRTMSYDKSGTGWGRGGAETRALATPHPPWGAPIFCCSCRSPCRGPPTPPGITRAGDHERSTHSQLLLSFFLCD
jgi:hypothetical protein